MIMSADRLPIRIQRALCDAGVVVLDLYLEDLARLAQGLPFDEANMADALPRKYLPRYDLAFAKEFVVCVSTVVWKLQSPDHQELACLAEEFALYAIVGRAQALLEVRGRPVDLGDVYEEAFQDIDFAFLFHPSFGEVEESEIGEHLRLANLRFEDWFEPFANVPYVHPYVADTSRSPHQSHGCPPQSDGEEARSVEEFVEETWNERANIG